MPPTDRIYEVIEGVYIGAFASSKGDVRLVYVTAGLGGHFYMNFVKVLAKLQHFCKQINDRRGQRLDSDNIWENTFLVLMPIISLLQFTHGLMGTDVCRV